MLDQLGREIRLEHPPRRIVSLVPSQTELLHHLDLSEEVAGITKFCLHPEDWHRTKPRIGGTKTIDMAAIHAIQPDLIIGNKEENSKEQIDELSRWYPVWMSDVNTLADALDMIRKTGELVDRTIQAEMLANSIEAGFDKLYSKLIGLPARTVAYLIWKNPLMAAGNHTFIDDLLRQCGLINCFKNMDRYPEITRDQLKKRNPEFIFLSSEPYPFNSIDQKEIQTELTGSRCIHVNGEFFSWYGPRLLQAVDYFIEIRTGMET